MADKCPICRKMAQEQFHPFCSARCTDIDLGRWLKGTYVIPGEDGEAAVPSPANDVSDEPL